MKVLIKIGKSGANQFRNHLFNPEEEWKSSQTEIQKLSTQKKQRMQNLPIIYYQINNIIKIYQNGQFILLLKSITKSIKMVNNTRVRAMSVSKRRAV